MIQVGARLERSVVEALDGLATELGEGKEGVRGPSRSDALRHAVLVGLRALGKLPPKGKPGGT